MRDSNGDGIHQGQSVKRIEKNRMTSSIAQCNAGLLSRATLWPLGGAGTASGLRRRRGLSWERRLASFAEQGQGPTRGGRDIGGGGIERPCHHTSEHPPSLPFVLCLSSLRPCSRLETQRPSAGKRWRSVAWCTVQAASCQDDCLAWSSRGSQIGQMRGRASSLQLCTFS